MVSQEESNLLKGTNLAGGDIAVIVIYFVLVMGFGIWSSLRNRGSLGGYFLAGRSMHWIPVGASLFASNIGSDHFIGLAGSGAATGTGISVFELNALIVLLFLGWGFVPVYIASGVYTMPEYMRARFGGQRIRVYLAVLALILAIFTKVAPALFAGAIFINQALKWDLYAAIILLLAIAALFTIAGGLTAVIWTDFIQTIIMVIGAFTLMIIAFINVGGFESLKYKYMRAVPNTTLYHPHPNYANASCGIPPSNALNLIRPADDPNYPWTGVIFGATISSVWYWCSDQVIVQRALAAKDLSHAKGGCLLAGYLKILPLWIIVFPGMISRVLFPDTVGCADPDTCQQVCGQRVGCTNIAYPLLVLKLMPEGARGLMLAVMLAALMSSLTSIFNSASTIFTLDIWTRIRKDAKDIELMIVGRVFVLVMVVIGIIWIPIVQSATELFHYIQSVTSFLSPPICAVYVLAVFWPRCNEHGAFWGLMIGLVVGLTRFIWENVYLRYPCEEGYKDNKPDIISKVHYLHFGCILFALVFIIAVVISLLTKKIDDKHLVRLTFWTRKSTEERIDISEARNKAKADVTTDNIASDQSAVQNPETNQQQNEHNLGQSNPAFSNTNEETTFVQNKELDTKDQLKEHLDQGQVNPTFSHNIDDTTSEKKPEDGPRIEVVPVPVKLPWWKTAINWICGIEKSNKVELSEEEIQQIMAKNISLDEEPKIRKFVNLQGIVLLTITIFFWTFFAELKE